MEQSANDQKPIHTPSPIAKQLQKDHLNLGPLSIVTTKTSQDQQVTIKIDGQLIFDGSLSSLEQQLKATQIA